MKYPLSLRPMQTLLQRDRQMIWHPFTQHLHARPLLPVSRGEGIYLIDENGNRYIDAISSWWTNIHGHAHPYIAQKIYEQALQLEQVIFAGCTHEPAVQLAERLLQKLPTGFAKLFYSDNGSTAVEVALKMAVQYQKNKSQNARTKIVALRHSYHGDTFGAMSVSERGVFTLPFADLLFEVIFIEPGEENATASLLPEEIACFIYEPLVQGAGGMNIYTPDWLNSILQFFKQHQVLCIADEVMTGFYRTGKCFASEYAETQPDIICLSKGLTGGSLPLAITACTEEIFSAFLSNNLHHTFFHGHSYTANPLACAAALASLDLLDKEDCLASVGQITAANRAFVSARNQQHATGNSLRSLGTILAFEFETSDHDYLNKVKEETMDAGLREGIFIRPLGNTVYIMPPYCINKEELNKLHHFLLRLLNQES